MEFTPSFFQFERRSTREILIQNPWTQLKLGGDTPIVYQSMITSDTLDTEACVQQTLDLAQAGCQLVRITAQTVRHAANLEHIAKALRDQECYVPLVADIHFKPEAAMEAAKFGIRINAVSPSIAMHEFLRKTSSPELLEKLTSHEAFGRAAEVWEVANVMMFLASDYSSYMTGEVVSVSSQHA